MDNLALVLQIIGCSAHNLVHKVLDFLQSVHTVNAMLVNM
jgi:hypothetical protein